MTNRIFEISAKLLVAADGRNSTVARLCHLMPRKGRDRVALQTHVPFPPQFRRSRLFCSFCAKVIPARRRSGMVCSIFAWSVGRVILLRFGVGRRRSSRFRPSTTGARSRRSRERRCRAAQPGLFLVGDAARVVEPFTGEGIYYALRSGELAAECDRRRAARASTPLLIESFTRADSGSTRSPASRSSIRALTSSFAADFCLTTPDPAASDDESRAALTVFAISIAIVIGPTPPGTGVIAAFSARLRRKRRRRRAGSRAVRRHRRRD